MKYSEGNLVVLNDGRTVYITAVHKKEKKHDAVTAENDSEMITIKESDIMMKLT